MTEALHAIARDTETYERIAVDWRDAHGIEQFFDANITLGGGAAAQALRERIQLNLVALASDTLSLSDASHGRKAKTISEILRNDFGLKTQEGAKAWEDYLTLVGFEYLTQVPPASGPRQLLAELLRSPESVAFHTLRCWPYLRSPLVRELLARTGYTAHLAARWWAVEPDVLIEGPEHLIFVENKPVVPTFPDHGKASKLGEMLVLGWLVARLGGKRFTLLAMTAPDGSVRLKDKKGTMTLHAASELAVHAVGVDPASEAGVEMVHAVRGFTWADVSAGMDRTIEHLAAASDTPNHRFYADLFSKKRALLSKSLAEGYRIGQRP